MEQKIRNYIDPAVGQKIFNNAEISFLQEKLSITLPFFFNLEKERVINDLQKYDYQPTDIEFKSAVKVHKTANNIRPLDKIKNIILVGSGKGGVGKSTVSLNLALALQKQGATVGLLDADIYGPSIAHMLGGAVAPTSSDNKKIEPNIRHHLQTLSIADLIDEKTAMIWRGPMAAQTLLQLIEETNWQNLDYLIIDLPPGTGDIQLSLSQKVPVTTAILVTTPQDIALLDVAKAKSMFDKVSIPIMGIIENMSYFICPHCHHQSAIFGENGGQAFAKKNHLPFLSQIPLDIAFRESADKGEPAINHHQELEAIYNHLAYIVGLEIGQLKTDFSHHFPKIVIETKDNK